jgi:hypothetical protein
MADFQFTNPGAAFDTGFEGYLTQQAAARHQTMLEDLQNKREQRLAQAELDSAAEKQDALTEKKNKDLADAHDKEVKGFQKHVADTYVKGDRPMPEDVATAQRLNLGGVFRQQAPAMETDTSAMAPAALQEAPAAGATAAGTGANLTDTTGAAEPGAMVPGPMSYPGSVAEREKADLDAKREAFIQTLPPEVRDSVRNNYKAEALGMKALTEPKAASADQEAVMRQNPRDGSVERLTPTGWVPHSGDVPKGAHWMTEPAPKDTSVHDMAQEAQLQRTREKAFERVDKEVGKSTLARITTAQDIQDALSQHTEAADATLAPLVLKATITSGGNSGFRMTKPEIDRVLTRGVWDNLALKLNAWTGNGPLQLDPAQREAMHKLAEAVYKKASDSYSKILDAEQNINHHQKDTDINDEVTKLKRDLAGSSKDTFYNSSDYSGSKTQGGPPTVAGTIMYDASGMPIPAGGR